MFNFKCSGQTNIGILKSDFASQSQTLSPSFLSGSATITAFGTCFGLMHISTTASTQMSAGASNVIGTVQSAFRPFANVHFAEGRGRAVFEIGTDGTVKLIPTQTISSGTEILADFFYPLLTFGGGA